MLRGIGFLVAVAVAAADQCPAGTHPIASGKQCYTAAMSWTMANAYCDSRHGTQLMTIRSEDEEDALMDSDEALFNRGCVWSGMNDREEEGTWVWASGERVGYRNWMAGEPNDYAGQEDCQVFCYAPEGRRRRRRLARLRRRLQTGAGDSGHGGSGHGHHHRADCQHHDGCFDQRDYWE